MKSMWKGSLGFGLVNINVRLYKATDDSSGVTLCNIHRTCGTAVKEPKWCPRCNQMLEAGDLQKAFPEDRKKEHCIPINEEELGGLQLPSTRSVQLDGFISEVPDLRYYDGVYVLEPDETGVRAFALLEQALKSSGLLGVAKITTGSKEHLCVVKPDGTGLLYLIELHWAADLRNLGELIRPKVQVSERELQVAKMLIDALPKGVNLTQYQNEYGNALKKLVEDKKAGVIITSTPPPATKEVDLVESLMASLKAVGVK